MSIDTKSPSKRNFNESNYFENKNIDIIPELNE